MESSRKSQPDLAQALHQVEVARQRTDKPLAVILAGHNGSGKSTLWYKHLADVLQIPLINADRMMMSILPETVSGQLPDWAQALRDEDPAWMKVAQQGVEAFVGHAMTANIPFALETVFSHWRDLGNGKVESKIDRIVQLQKAGYFVILFFVGLASDQLSIGRVGTRVASGGHNVDQEKLVARFPRTQKAIAAAAPLADACILSDNSLSVSEAFTVCRVQLGNKVEFDCRDTGADVPAPVLQWLDIISPTA
ncbi:toxin [Stenotrophomonas cyclobalanopsidis]|uniref:Toxin n=1 Tax=Stenotrophomonas cyclobalanopsidis TaxID=2771362 RepID=A0ABQ6T148_9GAMM|nr:zeta toxin family protein [Stenotrophomonas cyclobalanopsidis]KAA8999118.1 toxin [Stenotrophomonas cyclobalanopsidis]